jgi:hypothetical protein
LVAVEDPAVRGLARTRLAKSVHAGWSRSINDLEPVLDLFTPHGRTTTSIVHSAPVPPRPLPVC